MIRVQRASVVIRTGRLTVLQRQALAELFVTISKDEQSSESLTTVYDSALDALAPEATDRETNGRHVDCSRDSAGSGGQAMRYGRDAAVPSTPILR